MPSVRDILQKLQPSRAPAASEALTPETPVTVEAPSPEPQKPDEQKQKPNAPGNDLAQRMRVLAEQRTALARREVERQQDTVNQLREKVEDLSQKDMQPGELAVQLNSAEIRLNDSRADLARAEEAQMNTELSVGIKQGLGKEQDLGPKLAGGNKVGAMFGAKAKPAGLPAPDAPATRVHR